MPQRHSLLGLLQFEEMAPARRMNEERVRTAVVRLDGSLQGRMAKEEVEAGESFEEVLQSYDLSEQQFRDLLAVRQWLERNQELPEEAGDS